MGAACCKTDHPGPSSPHLPFCEVVRRCARQICPVDPPQQKPNHRIRKYGLSDIVGPVVKKDSWVQTDPLPPPRRRKKKNKQRRRSRSVEFLPYLIRRQSSRGSKNSRTSTCSLEDIRGQEDALDFQMFFMGRLPVEEGKDIISGKKKEFLSGLLGEENNNFVLSSVENNTEYESKKEENKLQKGANNTEEATATIETNPVEGQSSRKSSITESLREFESSLLEMLEEDDVSLTRELAIITKVNEIDEEHEVTLMEPIRKGNLTPLPEEKEEDYVFTLLETEKDEQNNLKESDTFNAVNKKETNLENVIFKKELNIIETFTNVSIEKTDKDLGDIITESQTFNDNISKEYLKNGPPKITIEIVS